MLVPSKKLLIYYSCECCNTDHIIEVKPNDLFYSTGECNSNVLVGVEHVCPVCNKTNEITLINE